MDTINTVQKIWGFCRVLRGDGISYNEYISELTYLLFLKIAKETGQENLLPEGYRWDNLVSHPESGLLGFYHILLTHLGEESENDRVKNIYKFPTTVFNHDENLKVVVDGINKLQWHSISKDSFGDIYEGLLQKNAESSGAGQYFTPRALVDAIIKVMKPKLGETIQDPASGTGGFLISTDKYLRDNDIKEEYRKLPPRYEGLEIEKGTYRLCLMNTFLHGMDANIILGDALTEDANELSPADLIIANPPFGSISGSVREKRKDIKFSSSNKQLDFLQHIYNGLSTGGRAAVVLPDNVLFEEGIGQKIRQDLMDKCDLHTILRLPTGIFYAHGVKTNVLFITRGSKDKDNTKNTWVYDLRTNMPNFGKRTPLTEKHFDDFVIAFGTDPLGKAKRKDEGIKGRFRKFTRSEIEKRDDNINISWFDDKNSADQNGQEPDAITAQIKESLHTALNEIEALQSILDPSSEIMR